jgi:NitT/TauT family transport system permease protein
VASTPLVADETRLANAAHRTRAPRRSGVHRRRPVGAGGWRSLAISTVSLLAGLGLWALAYKLNVVADYSLPSPWSVAHEWWLLARKGVIWHHIWATLREATLGFLLALVASALLAYPLAKSRVFASVLSPYIAATQAMPMLALAPLLVVWFGLGLFSHVLICAVIVFFPMLVNISVGLANVDRTLVEAAATEGAGRWATLIHIELPLALRTILAGVRMGATLSFTGAIVAEFVSASEGLGYLMEFARGQYDAPLLFAAALTIVVVAVLAYVLLGMLDYVLIDWE